MDAGTQTVSTDEVTVTKRIDRDRFNTPAVILDITSTADRSTSVTVTEPIPDSFPLANIGFHPEFGSEHWAISEDKIVFNRTLAPDDEYTTVYGLRNVTNDSLTKFLNSETVVSAGDSIGVALEDTTSGDDTAEELLMEHDDETVRRVITGANDSLVESEDEDTGVEEEDTGEDTGVEEGDADEDTGVETDVDVDAVSDVTEDVAEETEDGEKILASEFEDLEEEIDGSEVEDVETGEATDEYEKLPDSVAEALAGEIRDGSITEEDERVLRETFSQPPETQRNVDIRIKRLQTEVADLAAYVDEFERILEVGDDEYLESLEATLTEVTERVESLEESIDTVNRRLAEIEAGLETPRDDLGELEDRSGDADALEGRLENVEMAVEDILYLEEDVMELNDQLDVVQQLDETVEKLDAEMEEMKSFRNRLSSAFGPDADRLEERDE
jgi:hypothetical protein